jgi:hypothetical protein
VQGEGGEVCGLLIDSINNNQIGQENLVDDEKINKIRMLNFCKPRIR